MKGGKERHKFRDLKDKQYLNMTKPGKDSLDLEILSNNIEDSFHFCQRIRGLDACGKNPLPFGTMYHLRFGRSDFKLIDPQTNPPKGAYRIGKSYWFSPCYLWR